MDETLSMSFGGFLPGKLRVRLLTTCLLVFASVFLAATGMASAADRSAPPCILTAPPHFAFGLRSWTLSASK